MSRLSHKHRPGPKRMVFDSAEWVLPSAEERNFSKKLTQALAEELLPLALQEKARFAATRVQEMLDVILRIIQFDKEEFDASHLFFDLHLLFSSTNMSTTFNKFFLTYPSEETQKRFLQRINFTFTSFQYCPTSTPKTIQTLLSLIPPPTLPQIKTMTQNLKDGNTFQLIEYLLTEPIQKLWETCDTVFSEIQNVLTKKMLTGIKQNDFWLGLDLLDNNEILRRHWDYKHFVRKFCSFMETNPWQTLEFMRHGRGFLLNVLLNEKNFCSGVNSLCENNKPFGIFACWVKWKLVYADFREMIGSDGLFELLRAMILANPQGTGSYCEGCFLYITTSA